MEIISKKLNTDCKVLSSSDQLELVKKYNDAKDIETKNKLRNILVMRNSKLVYKICYKYRTRPNFPDIISEGFLGLIHCLDKFDYTKNTKISPYAWRWILAYVKRFIMKDRSLIMIGKTKNERQCFNNLSKEIKWLESKGLEVTDKVLAERLLVPESDVVDMRNILQSNISILEEGRKNDEKSLEIPSDFDLEAKFNNIQLKNIVIKFRNNLNSTEKTVLDLRIIEGQTLQFVADTFSPPLSRERMRQVEQNVKEKLHKFVVNNKFKEMY